MKESIFRHLLSGVCCGQTGREGFLPQSLRRGMYVVNRQKVVKP